MATQEQVDTAAELRQTVAKLNKLVRQAANINLKVKLTQAAYEFENTPNDPTGWADIQTSIILNEQL